MTAQLSAPLHHSGHDESEAVPFQQERKASTEPRHLTIGYHVSASGGYQAMFKRALAAGANTFQFFTRNPRGGKAAALDPSDVQAFHEQANQAYVTRILAHAPYTLNAAAAEPRIQDFAREAFTEDLLRMEETPYQLYNFHPGSHVKQGVEVGIDKIAAVLADVMHEDQTTTILLETMAGKGTEIGRSFNELRQIIDRVPLGARLGVCLDTCHVWDAGYDIKDHLDDVLEEFDRVIGLNRLHAIHLNDSKNPLGAHKDRHEKIGLGHIGFEALSAVTRHPALRHLPFYLETPNELEGYADEIARLREAWDCA